MRRKQFKYEVIGLLDGKRITVTVWDVWTHGAIEKGLKKIGTKQLISCELIGGCF